MRNLVVFLARNYFFLLFLLLEVLSLYFLVQRNYFQHARAVSASHAFTGTLFEWRTQFVEYLDLKEQNKHLAEKLAYTLTADSAAWMMYTSRTTPVIDTVFKQRFEFLAALVVDNTVSRRNNYLIINRGRLQGAREDMGVISPDGIVGIIVNVSDNFSLVMSVLHKDSKISASIKQDGTFGQLRWNGKNYREATLLDLPTHAKLNRGDTLVTSGLGDAFPAGIPVGTVLGFETKPGDKTFTVDIQLTTDFRKLRHVLIIKNLMREEIGLLREKIKVDD
ncbi:MAG TPA: rod shape-determining protein MreC [Bacteroidia bacterium]|nr:rod shape-determining protein MreC [Bacteroidia bacterium]